MVKFAAFETDKGWIGVRVDTILAVLKNEDVGTRQEYPSILVTETGNNLMVTLTFGMAIKCLNDA